MVREVHDEQARFKALVVPYLSDALAFARWLTKNRADAEDAVAADDQKFTLADEVVSSHMRGLMAPSSTDVKS